MVTYEALGPKETSDKISSPNDIAGAWLTLLKEITLEDLPGCISSMSSNLSDGPQA